MFTTGILLVSAALGAVAAPVQQSTGTFSVTAHINPVFTKNGPAQLRKTLLKYGLELPHGLTRRQDGSVNANPSSMDEQYVCPVTIGSSTLNLDFDTGSADLWVFSNELPTAQRGDHHIFTPSSSFKKSAGQTWSISYGDGSSASGDVGTDKVTVGTTVVTGQTVELAKTVADSFVQDKFSDGLLGLAFSTINTVQTNGQQTPQKTFIENALPNLKAGLFAADLKHSTPGSYDFGFIDDKKHTGELAYTPIDSSNGFWEFPALNYKVANSTFSSGAGSTAIADTGTTLILVSNEIAAKYYASVKGAKNDQTQGGYTFPCSATLPDLSLAIGSAYANIPGSALNYAPVDQTGATCFGGLQGAPTKQFIYGDIFFKAYYSVFDLAGTRFGFAPKA